MPESEEIRWWNYIEIILNLATFREVNTTDIYWLTFLPKIVQRDTQVYASLQRRTNSHNFKTHNSILRWVYYKKNKENKIEYIQTQLLNSALSRAEYKDSS